MTDELLPKPTRSLLNVLHPDPSPAAAEAAFIVDQRLKATVRRMRGMWVELARDLYRFHQGELWRDLGAESFEKWLGDPELDLERRWVYDVMAMYKQLVVDRGVEVSRLQELQVSKVREVVPAIRRGLVTVEEALEDATELRRADLEIKYRGRASDGVTAGPDQSTAVRTEREPEWKKCSCCGSMIQTTPTD